jgi:hypothetical protein
MGFMEFYDFQILPETGPLLERIWSNLPPYVMVAKVAPQNGITLKQNMSIVWAIDHEERSSGLVSGFVKELKTEKIREFCMKWGTL